LISSSKAGILVVQGLPISPCDVDGIKFPVSRIRRSSLLKSFWSGYYLWGCPRTRSPEKRGKIFIKGQINNPNEKMFYLERYSRKEQFNSTNQSVLSHSGLFPVTVARLHILLRFQ
jgi:hypothetical protein